MGGRKAGFAHLVLRPGSHRGAPALELRMRMEMKAAFGRLAVDLVEESSRIYEPTGAQRLVAVRKRQVQGALETRLEVLREGEKMIAVRRVAGREERREIPASQETARDEILTGTLGRNLRAGEVLSGHVFFEDLLRDFEVRIRVLSSGPEVVGGVRLDLVRARVEGLPMGLGVDARLTPAGDLVVATIGPATLRLEGEAAARAPYATTDLLDIAPRVGKLSNRLASEVRLRVRGLPPGLLVEDSRQRVERLADGSTRITLRRLARPPAAVPSIPVKPTPELAPALAPTPVLQADHPEIRRAAQAAIGGERNAFRAALRLRDWVHRRMRPIWHRTLDALTALRAGGGMCYELSHVLAAMARAVGIPARLAYGLVYAEVGDRAVLGGHAWTELWVGAWIPFDATEPRGPSIGPHLKLGGEDSAGKALLALTGLTVEWE
jgi:transglutaminase-like putative cysteine protease